MEKGPGHIEEDSFEDTVEQIVARNDRYDRKAYLFVRDSLRLTVESAIKGGHPSDVQATDVLNGLRESAVEQFGPMAKFVLEEWGIHSCQDFGEILFNLAEAGFLANSAKGCRTAFGNGFDFDTALRKPFLPQEEPALDTCG
jgi:uncharacterized repeat protein (TIGR04138 family)